ncbi:MAG: hypothetical protein H7Y00_16640 [Fimbriimonadaceae bacterium]|nr:hypothetical protein [Chitinophagales bacterium]
MIHLKRKYLFLVFCLPFLFNRCGLGEPQIPSYIYIDTFSLSCDLSSQGFNSQKITDGWVYVNNKTIGVFQLPALVPVLDTGNLEIIISPGIKDNGIQVFGKVYPFYTSHKTTMHLSAEQTDTIYPATTYYSTGLTYIIDRFETGNIFSPAVNSDTSFVELTDPAEVFEGSRSMQATLEGNNYFFRAGTFDLILPDDGSNVYLEMDYKNDTQFEVWVTGNLLGSQYPEYVITLTPKDTWNKIYVNIGNIIRLIQTETYSIELRMARPASAISATLSIDNVKIISEN